MSINQHDLFEHAQHASWHGRYFRCYCPFHGEGPGSKMPSLLVYEDGAVCLGRCGNKRYTLNQLEKKLKGQIGSRFQSVRDSLGWRNLSDDDLEKLSLYAQNSLEVHWGDESSIAIPYLESRNLFRAECSVYGLGYLSNHITIPVLDINGDLIALVGRNVGDGERYYQSRPPLPYTPNWMDVPDAKNVLVVYGIFDAIQMDLLIHKYNGDSDFAVITSTHGKNFNPEWLAPFRKRIIPIPDAGEEKDAYKLSGYLGWRGQKPLLLPYTDKLKDPADFIEQGKEKQLWRLVSAIKN